ncbi:uncharacterized protein E0L32_003349 [Thyridium curvatum]|uniref:Uncharacterized protein n=1 Tax=Thyridium curvatum TaxID=1093900 RepID=A0A507BJJ6_9PEZI|nr:uncharacterized protein E0L32_003349 [Thyridium curvatum]TPX17231.1 hypothetical protein E0L32_003349 [Thyridium curvatum]
MAADPYHQKLNVVADHEVDEPMNETRFSAARFASTPELLLCLGDQIYNRKTLLNLSRSSKLFYQIFSRYLFRELVLIHPDVNKLHNGLNGTRFLAYVQSLTICVHTGCRVKSGRYNAFLQSLLPRMPRLSKLKWSNLNMTAATVYLVQKYCVKLQRLHVEYTDKEFGPLCLEDSQQHPLIFSPGARYHHSAFQNPKFQNFAGLTELVVLRMFDDLPRWRHSLLTAILNCPGLEKLGLSIAGDTAIHALRPPRSSNSPSLDTYWTFLMDLCDDYGKTGAGLLRLKSLHIGLEIKVQDLLALKKLTDTAFLQELSITNKAFNSWTANYPIERVLNQADFPSLRRLVLAGLNSALVDFFRSGKEKDLVRKLAFIVRENTPQTVHTGQLFCPTSSENSFPVQLRMASLTFDLSASSADDTGKVCKDLVEYSAETLEGLAVNVKIGMWLGGGNMRSFQRQLSTAVSKLPRLTQLFVHMQSYYSQYEGTDLAATTIFRLAHDAPRIRYIYGGGQFWEISKGPDGATNRSSLALIEGDHDAPASVAPDATQHTGCNGTGVDNPGDGNVAAGTSPDTDTSTDTHVPMQVVELYLP